MSQETTCPLLNHEKLPYNIDLTAVVLLMAGAANFIIVKSRLNRSIGRVDLVSDEGWKRIDKGIDILFKGLFDDEENPDFILE